jgi:hypothetical protein
MSVPPNLSLSDMQDTLNGQGFTNIRVVPVRYAPVDEVFALGQAAKSVYVHGIATIYVDQFDNVLSVHRGCYWPYAEAVWQTPSP